MGTIKIERITKILQEYKDLAEYNAKLQKMAELILTEECVCYVEFSAENKQSVTKTEDHNRNPQKIPYVERLLSGFLTTESNFYSPKPKEHVKPIISTKEMIEHLTISMRTTEEKMQRCIARLKRMGFPL